MKTLGAFRWLAALLALAVCACGPVPGSRPTATYGFLRSPTPDPANFTATHLPPATPTAASGATSTPPAYPPPATAGPSLTPRPYVPPPNTPTASLTPRESHTPRPSPTPTQSPTATPDLSPTPDPRILSHGAVPCRLVGEFRRCTDAVLGLTFEQPAAWGPITATLRESYDEAGLAYYYQYGGLPRAVSAGGLSADFAEGRDGGPTDFAGSGRLGFNGASPAEWCAGLAAAACEVVQPNVVLALRWPWVEEFCGQEGGYFQVGQLAWIWVLLPDNPQINGFVFVAPFLSDEASEHVLDLRRDLLGWEDLTMMHTACGPEQQAEFDEAIADFMADLESGQADADTRALVAGVRHLAESIRPAP